MPYAGVHLFEHNVAVTDAADFKFANVVPDYVLEAFAIAAELGLGLVYNGNALLERQLKMVPYPRDRHALVQIIRIILPIWPADGS